MIMLSCGHCSWKVETDDMTEAINSDRAHDCDGRQAAREAAVGDSLPHRNGMTTDELESYERHEW